MLKRNGETVEHTVPGYAGRLTRSELEAYNAAYKTIRPEFSELEKLQEQLNKLARVQWDHPANQQHFTSLETADGVRWDAYGQLLKTSKSEVLLCRQSTGALWAVIQRFQPDAPYAQAHGTTEVLLTGNDARELATNYTAHAQHTLRFMASNLVARTQKVAWEQFPESNPRRVVHALSERCYVAIGEREAVTVKQAESLIQTQRRSHGIRP
jgi:hypothetical protein